MGMSVQERLFALKDEDFARFQSALIPNIPKETVVGVRMPMIRKLAKEIAGEAETQAFPDRTAACVLRRKHAAQRAAFADEGL